MGAADCTQVHGQGQGPRGPHWTTEDEDCCQRTGMYTVVIKNTLTLKWAPHEVVLKLSMHTHTGAYLSVFTLKRKEKEALKHSVRKENSKCCAKEDSTSKNTSN